MQEQYTACDYVKRNLLTHEVLDKEEERELIIKAQSDNGEAQIARDRLVLCNMRFIYTYCMKWANIKEELHADDLIGDAVAGFLQAIDKFDLSYETRLTSYAGYRIMHSIGRSDLLNDVIRLPQHQKDNARELHKAQIRLRQDGIRDPSNEELSEESGISVRHILQIEQYVGKDKYISIHQKVGDDGEVTLQDRIADPTISEQELGKDLQMDIESVSYTHLTLPTICSV